MLAELPAERDLAQLVFRSALATQAAPCATPSARLRRHFFDSGGRHRPDWGSGLKGWREVTAAAAWNGSAITALEDLD
jgi:hypothetical protein